MGGCRTIGLCGFLHGIRLQQILHQRQGSFIRNQSKVGMQLQNGAGSLGLDGAEEAVLHRLRLIFAVAHQHHPLGLHDGADAHGVGVSGNVLPLGEEALVGVDGGCGQFHLVGALDEGVRRLIEADVTIGAKAQQL